MNKPNSQLERLYLLLVEDIIEGDINVAKQVISDAGYDPEASKAESKCKLQEIMEAHEREKSTPDLLFMGTDFTVTAAGFFSCVFAGHNSASICREGRQIAKDDTGDINDAYAQANASACHFSDTMHLSKICN